MDTFGNKQTKKQTIVYLNTQTANISKQRSDSHFLYKTNKPTHSLKAQ